MMDIPLALERAAPRRLWHFALAGLLPPAAFIIGIAAGLLIVNFGGNSDAIQPFGLIALFALMLVGNVLWAHVFARLAGMARPKRFIIVAAFAQIAITFALVVVLGRAEEHFVQNGNTTLPLHILYTLLFVPSTFICAFIIGVVSGVAMSRPSLAWRMGLHGAMATSLAFLVLNVLQDVLGRRVGGPNATATATMVTVTVVCWLAASMAFSTALGRLMLAEDAS